jgi:hypothetical protein
MKLVVKAVLVHFDKESKIVVVPDETMTIPVRVGPSVATSLSVARVENPEEFPYGPYPVKLRFFSSQQ